MSLRKATPIALCVLIFVFVAVANAQGEGQFCVRAFEDRNGDGLRDPGEPLLQAGISAELTNASGVIIGSALLIDSPTASQGIICFEGLDSGQYGITVTSAEYASTTAATMMSTISEGGLPAVMEFGAQRVDAINAEALDTAAETDTDEAVQRLLLAALGALVVATGMFFIGLIFFVIIMRDRRRNAPVRQTGESYRTDTSEQARVRDTGEYYRR